MAKSTDEIRAAIYPLPPETLAEKLADKLARDDGYVVITHGTRQQYLCDAEDILYFIKENDRG